MRLEHDPIHRHKDVLTHSIAVVENVRPPHEHPAIVAGERPSFDFRLTRLAALFHDVGKPKTRGYQPGKGTTFHHHDAVGARITKKRMTALRVLERRHQGRHRTRCAAPAVPHLLDGMVRLGGASLRARRRTAAARTQRVDAL